MHKLTATTSGMQWGPTLAGETWPTLCSVMLGVNGICWSEFGRPALLTHSAGKLRIPSESPKVFNHLPHGTCFMYFFRKNCVCMDNYSFISKLFGIGAVSPVMQILE